MCDQTDVQATLNIEFHAQAAEPQALVILVDAVPSGAALVRDPSRKDSEASVGIAAA